MQILQTDEPMNKTNFLYLNSRDEFLRVEISKIVYFHADGNYTKIVLTNKTMVTIGMNLSKMLNVLNENLRESAGIFIRVGKSLIINSNYVFRIIPLRQRLILSDGEKFEYQLPVSKEALKSLKLLYVGNQKERLS